jgi:hypothetical protein
MQRSNLLILLPLFYPVSLVVACSDNANLGSNEDEVVTQGNTTATAGNASGASTVTNPTSPTSEPTGTPVPSASSSGPVATEPTGTPVPSASSSGPVLSEDSGTPVPSASSSSGGPDAPPECLGDIFCFRPVDCVATCGGEVLQTGCCPCPEGSFDSIECTVSSSEDASVADTGSLPDTGGVPEGLNLACVDDACPVGLTPIHFYGVAGTAGPEFCSCSIPCEDDPTICPEPTVCITIGDGPGTVCYEN